MATQKKTPKTSPKGAPEISEKKNDISSPSDVGGNDISFASSNIVEAVEALGVSLSVGASTGAVGGVPAEKVVYVRVSEGKHADWVLAAELCGVSLAELVRSAVDPVVEGVVRCLHPSNMLQVYAWQTTCLKCGRRIRG